MLTCALLPFANTSHQSLDDYDLTSLSVVPNISRFAIDTVQWHYILTLVYAAAVGWSVRLFQYGYPHIHIVWNLDAITCLENSTFIGLMCANQIYVWFCFCTSIANVNNRRAMYRWGNIYMWSTVDSIDKGSEHAEADGVNDPNRFKNN